LIYVHTVWVELSPEGLPVRIFKSVRSAWTQASQGGFRIAQMTHQTAVQHIRHQIFVRSKGFCEECGSVITESSMEMHERLWRGKGGEISLENSIAACKGSHKFAHRDRAPKFSRRKP